LFDVLSKNSKFEIRNSKFSADFGRRVLILGIGNILLRDEGIGVHIVNQLQKYDLPDNVEIIDGGTAALDILLSQKGLHKLVVIDAVRAGNEPGTIVKFEIRNSPAFAGVNLSPQERGFEILAGGQSQITLHQFGLLDALAIAEKLGLLPEEIVVIGVEPGELDLGLELTEEVAQSVPEIIKQVLEEIQDVIHRK